MGKLVLCYWDGIQGRGTAIRYLLAHALVDYEFKVPVEMDATYMDKPFHHQLEWRRLVKPKMQNDGFVLVNLPYIIDGETNVSAMFPCLDYLADKYGYNGQTKSERARISSVMDVLKDAFGTWFYGCALKPKAAELDRSMIKPVLRYLSTVHMEHVQRKTSYLVTDTMSQADIYFFEIMTRMTVWYRSVLHNFPELVALFNKLMADEKLKAQYKIEMKMPITTQYLDRLEEVDDKTRQDPIMKELGHMFNGVIPYMPWGSPRKDGSDYFEAFYE